MKALVIKNDQHIHIYLLCGHNKFIIIVSCYQQ